MRGSYVRDVGVAGSNVVTLTIDFTRVFFTVFRLRFQERILFQRGKITRYFDSPWTPAVERTRAFRRSIPLRISTLPRYAAISLIIQPRRILIALHYYLAEEYQIARLAQTNIVQTAKLQNVIEALGRWRWMNHAAETAGRFYRDMYNHEAFA